MTRPLAPTRAFFLWQSLVLGLALASCGGEADTDAKGAADGGGPSGDDGGERSSEDAASAGGDGSQAGRPSSSGSDAGNQSGSMSDASASSGASDAGAGGASADAGAAADGGGPPTAERFSFFVTSHAAIIELAKDPEGFGGDLRYGETGPGAGLRGADKICGEIAEHSMPGAGKKQWRAFLSAAAGGESGGPIHARDRIGQGPWYDRKGRLVGNTVADLISGDRPSMADPMIRDDLPNESGTPNHAPEGRQIDNHDTLTGSDRNGRYVSGANTCQDWTSSATTTGGGGGGPGGSGPAIGHSWPRSANNGRNWISDHRAGGCGKGVNLGGGSTDGTPTVGSGGGYGGWYCFALTP